LEFALVDSFTLQVHNYNFFDKNGQKVFSVIFFLKVCGTTCYFQASFDEARSKKQVFYRSEILQ
jgi:hypothetical protein